MTSLVKSLVTSLVISNTLSRCCDEHFGHIVDQVLRCGLVGGGSGEGVGWVRVWGGGGGVE